MRELYPEISDIMVNYKKEYQVDYLYYSDAGRMFKRIYDPLTNDVKDTSAMDITFDSFEAFLHELTSNSENKIISTHPHRWTSSAFAYRCKALMFKIIKALAKLAIKIPLLKKLASRYYYLAKKI